MPMHAWTRVSVGTFYAFHNAWITHLQEALNGGLLPDPYYALGEQSANEFRPDVLTLKAEENETPDVDSSFATDDRTMVAVAVSPPQVHSSQEAIEDIAYYIEKQRSVAIRHTSGDRMVAIIEIVSRSNRHSIQTLNDFADKVIASLHRGIHVVVIDPFPSGRNGRASKNN